MKTRCSQYLTFPCVLLSLCLDVEASEPGNTGFSYSGSLVAKGNQANGVYDLRFALFDSSTNGTSVATPLTNSAMLINNGLFNVLLDFGPTAFNGDKRWLEIGVRTNGAPGDFEPLVPRQELVPQPYALYAGNAGIAATALTVAPGVLSGAFALTNSGNTFTGDGSGLTGVNAATLNGHPAADFWQTGGNAGTTAGVNFLGTTDNQPLELKVNNARGLRIEPTMNGTPNLVGGSAANAVSSGVVGATISGGGDFATSESNSVAEIYGTIGGGAGNAIELLHLYGTIAGGFDNTLSFTPGQYALPNLASANTIGGGSSNSVWESFSVIAGGSRNRIGSPESYGFPGHVIGGGEGNVINYENRDSTISGGFGNWLDASTSDIGGGMSNSIYYLDGAGHSIGGGIGNQIYGSIGCNISGGTDNSIGIAYRVAGDYSTIGGGQSNVILNSYCVIAGGVSNSASAVCSTIGGGQNNAASSYCVVAGGAGNTANAMYSTVPGGAQATTRLFGQMAYASGQFASAGDAQTSLYVCRRLTSNANQSELFLDGASARMIVPTNSTWAFDILISGRASNGDSAAYRFVGAIKNNNGVMSLVGSPLKNALGQDVASWDANISANTANQALALNVIGAAATSIRWVANVRTTEVVY